MDVLFIILNYKTYKDTILISQELLSSQTTLDYMILIVDNKSPNESYEHLRNSFAGIERIEVISSGENGGYAKGNNFGLRYAKKYRPKYACIINNDVHFSMRTIENLCVWYEILTDAAFIAPKQMLPDGKEAVFSAMGVPTLRSDIACYNPFYHKKHLYTENTHIKHVHKIGIIPGAFIFTSYNRFEALGFFDESTFLFCEERFIAKKAQLAGLTNYIILDETYLHDHSTTIKDEVSEKRQRKMILEGRCLYHLKFSSHSFYAVAILKTLHYINELFVSIVHMGKKIKHMVR